MKKIRHERIDFPVQSTIKINYAQREYFRHPWHFHEEHQITYVIKSTGTRFVGDNISSFKAGDLVFVAGNLPHFWRSDEIYLKGNPKHFVDRLIIQFPNDFLKSAFNNYLEFKHINQLLEEAKRGIQFLQPAADKLGKMLLKLGSLKGFQQIMHFIEILDQMACNQNIQLLASEEYQAQKLVLNDERLRKIIKYLLSNYPYEISYYDLADKVSMHPGSLSRYFKEKTGENISAYINKLRIGYACKLLIEGTLQISQICFEAGFNNISNFNRHFKEITSYTPKQYREEFLRTRELT